jgi:serine/threonine-protein kinase RIO1
MALDFLRRDCAIINDFFKKKKVPILSTQNTFNFVTDIVEINNENEE